MLIEVEAPDGNARLGYEESNHAEVTLTDPAAGAYVVRVMGSQAFGATSLVYAASATLTGAGGSAASPTATVGATPTAIQTATATTAPTATATQAPAATAAAAGSRPASTYALPTRTATPTAPRAKRFRARLTRRRTTRASAIGRGFVVRLCCSDDCRASLSARVGPKTARRLRLGRGVTALGRLGGVSVGRGTGTAFRIRLTSRARRALARRRDIGVTLRATVIAPSGDVFVVRKRLRLR